VRPSFPAFCVVVPAFREIADLGHVHARLQMLMHRLGDPWDVVYVNEGDADATRELQRILNVGHPQIELLDLARARRTGVSITAALSSAPAETVFVASAEPHDAPGAIVDLVTAWRERTAQRRLPRSLGGLASGLRRQCGALAAWIGVGIGAISLSKQRRALCRRGRAHFARPFGLERGAFVSPRAHAAPLHRILAAVHPSHCGSARDLRRAIMADPPTDRAA
jgi:hypothetical protein